jgi:hypothetical protein
LPLHLIEKLLIYDGNECARLRNPMFSLDGSTDLSEFLRRFPVGIPSGIGIIRQDAIDSIASPQQLPSPTCHMTPV